MTTMILSRMRPHLINKLSEIERRTPRESMFGRLGWEGREEKEGTSGHPKRGSDDGNGETI
jgi:hypothetical protein